MRTRIAAVAEQEWQPSNYRTGSQVCSFSWQPKSWKRARRFVVRRDPVEPGEQLLLEGREWHYWALVTNDHERSADELERWQRAKANVDNRIKEAKLGFALDNLPSQRFHANWAAHLLCTLLAYDLLVWLKLLALPEGERASYAKRLRFRFLAVAASVGRSGRRLVLRPGRLPALRRLLPHAHPPASACAGARHRCGCLRPTGTTGPLEFCLIRRKHDETWVEMRLG